MSDFMATGVSARRRIACAVSGGAVIVGALIALALGVALIAGVSWLWTNTVWFSWVCIAIAVTVFLTLNVLMINDALKQRAVSKKRLREYYADYPEKRESLKLKLSDFKPLLVAAGFVVFEAVMVLLWAAHLPFVVNNFWIKEIKPSGLLAGVITAMFTQTLLGFAGTWIWHMLDNGYWPRGTVRFGACWILGLIPLWAMQLGPHVFTSFTPVTASWIAWLCALPAVGMTLGAAYSCRENVFDMMGFGKKA